ncbi:hypothetical protein B4102_2622 [Heyndrickxia sporothermodurans]|uniref:Uncharacterized protein n=1 Tax=Heyndrickxia sporothermodurans TaxID=46224 RepID=A0A150LA06_9BACI|nr:hypothetical protein B4102_2622 [Heyndrickxia sporothermodurans]
MLKVTEKTLSFGMKYLSMLRFFYVKKGRRNDKCLNHYLKKKISPLQ